MTCTRWISVCVDLLDHPSFQGPYDRRSAWLWLIANAAWKDHRSRTRGGMIDIKRGEVVASSERLAEIWGWSRKKVRTFLGELTAEGMIAKGPAKNQYVTIISICNYDKYQSVAAKEATERASEGPAKGQRRASEGPHSTKDTKDTSKDNTPTVEQVAAREAGRPADAVKAAFNGQTESMVAEVAAHMQGDTAAAKAWLLTTLQTYDQASVREAWHMLVTARSEGQTILKPLRWWAKTASTLKAQAEAKALAAAAPKPKPKIQYLDEPWIREAREALGL
jgi:hypothetical protein